MPTYTYECPKCEDRVTVFLHLDEQEVFKPKHCGKKMYQVIAAPMVMRDIQPYKSMIDGRMITSRSEHRTHLKDRGCFEIGNEMPKPRTPEKPKMSRREALHRQLADVSDKEANKLIKRAIKETHV